jgi:hypothetical protein
MLYKLTLDNFMTTKKTDEEILKECQELDATYAYSYVKDLEKENSDLRLLLSSLYNAVNQEFEFTYSNMPKTVLRAMKAIDHYYENFSFEKSEKL